jgi:hypothetical protein
MLNMPSVRTAVGLLRTYVINRANFLGLTRYLPLDFTSQLQSSTIQYWVEGVLVGLMAPHKIGTDAYRMQARKRTRKTQGTAFWRGARSIDETDLLTVLDVNDPDQKRLAGRQLVLEALQDLGDQIIELMEWTAWKALDNDLQAYDVNGVSFQINYGLPAKINVGSATGYSEYWTNAAAAKPHVDIQTALGNFAGTGVTQVDVVMNQSVSLLLSQVEAIEDRLSNSMFAFMTGNQAVTKALAQLIQGDMGAATPGAPRLRDVLVYDEGYHSAEDTYTRFLPSDTVFLIGSRPPAEGERGPSVDAGTVGRWMSTPAIHEAYDDIKPGPFVNWEDQTKISPKQVAMEAGINGLPVIQRPTWIYRLKVTA